MKEIFVYADWKELNGCKLLGNLKVETTWERNIFF